MLEKICSCWANVDADGPKASVYSAPDTSKWILSAFIFLKGLLLLLKLLI